MNNLLTVIALMLAPLAALHAAELHQVDSEISLQVPLTNHPCVAWGASRLEAALAQAGYRLTAGARTIVNVAVSPTESLLAAKARNGETTGDWIAQRNPLAVEAVLCQEES